ncbi:L,D-transpeptidase family protein [Ensifer sp.]|jgi:L,D-peptidoglycan transpeptidase YkuD (ErfK/YbiS/YcfS/YnhG family)/predicted deacylase|uniref:L,D-transpeptidase family protein n=1 Tax=Ensifer sp. TaxID=1872086 RepID=UPI002E0FF0AF|nr:succinylglutamate desuccinylase/aspartoacylase family protein [Ensifer sp.]
MVSIPVVKVRVSASADPCHRGTLSIGDWTVPCVVGRAGLVPANLKREGDGRTPIGVFPLRYGFFDPVARPDFPRDLAFPFVPASADMIWEEAGPHYNRLVYAEDGERTDDRLTRKRAEPLFDVVVPIGFNDAVARVNGGSALFIHAARADLAGTAGCVAVAAADVMSLMRHLRPGMLIDIDFEPRSAAADTEDDGDPIEVVRFCGLERGPKLIVTGAVHGNETCGPDAIWKVIRACRTGELSVRRGEVTFVPVVNGKAYRQGTREGDRNLNRDLREAPVVLNYEDRVANVLCPLLRQHDVLLDIHSYRSAGEPFVFLGPENNTGTAQPFARAEEEESLAVRLGPQLIMHGWLDAYAKSVAEQARHGGTGGALSHAVGTTEYMRACGGYGLTLECGQHQDPDAADVAYQAIVRTLAHLGIIDAPAPEAVLPRVIHLADVVLCLSAGDRLEKTWRTGDPVMSGEIIARRASGEIIAAPREGFVIFPDAAAEPLKELFYFGVASDRFADH